MIEECPSDAVWFHGLSVEDYAVFTSLLREIGWKGCYGRVDVREEDLPLSLQMSGGGTVAVWIAPNDWPIASQVLEAMHPWFDGSSAKPRFHLGK